MWFFLFYISFFSSWCYGQHNDTEWNLCFTVEDCNRTEIDFLNATERAMFNVLLAAEFVRSHPMCKPLQHCSPWSDLEKVEDLVQKLYNVLPDDIKSRFVVPNLYFTYNNRKLLSLSNWVEQILNVFGLGSDPDHMVDVYLGDLVVIQIETKGKYFVAPATIGFMSDYDEAYTVIHQEISYARNNQLKYPVFAMDRAESVKFFEGTNDKPWETSPRLIGYLHHSTVRKGLDCAVIKLFAKGHGDKWLDRRKNFLPVPREQYLLQNEGRCLSIYHYFVATLDKKEENIVRITNFEEMPACDLSLPSAAITRDNCKAKGLSGMQCTFKAKPGKYYMVKAMVETDAVEVISWDQCIHSTFLPRTDL